MCPSAVCRVWVACRKMRSSRCLISKASLGSLHTLGLPLFRLSGLRGGNLKIPKNTGRLSRVVNPCQCVRAPFFFQDGEVEGQVGRSAFTQRGLLK